MQALSFTILVIVAVILSVVIAGGSAIFGFSSGVGVSSGRGGGSGGGEQRLPVDGDRQGGGDDGLDSRSVSGVGVNLTPPPVSSEQVEGNGGDTFGGAGDHIGDDGAHYPIDLRSDLASNDAPTSSPISNTATPSFLNVGGSTHTPKLSNSPATSTTAGSTTTTANSGAGGSGGVEEWGPYDAFALGVTLLEVLWATPAPQVGVVVFSSPFLSCECSA